MLKFKIKTDKHVGKGTAKNSNGLFFQAFFYLDVSNPTLFGRKCYQIFAIEKGIKTRHCPTKNGDTTMTTYEVTATFDASGLRCPMPILKTKKEVQQIEVGQILKVIATDVGTKKDIPAWAERSGNEILEMVEEGDKIIWYIKRIK